MVPPQSQDASVALLSNMPVQMAERHLDEASWTNYSSNLHFSGMLGVAKPDRRIFDHVVADLKARTQDVVFIDDNEVNIATTQSLGFRTILHTSATDLREELSKVSGQRTPVTEPSAGAALARPSQQAREP